MKSTKEIAEIAGAVAERLEGLTPSDVERVLKVMRALRGEPTTLPINPTIAPFIQPVNPAPSLPIGNPWPAPTDFQFQIHSAVDRTACAGNIGGEVWIDQLSPGVATTAVLSTETI